MPFGIPPELAFSFAGISTMEQPQSIFLTPLVECRSTNCIRLLPRFTKRLRDIAGRYSLSKTAMNRHDHDDAVAGMI